MKILFDSQAFDMQRYGGVSRLYASLFEGLNNTKENLEYTIPIGQTNNAYLLSMPQFADEKYRVTGLAAVKDFKGKKALVKLLGKVDPNSSYSKVVRELKKQEFDIFHPTYYNPYFLKYLGKKPYVLTVYDMIHELYPQYFKVDRAAAFKKKVIPPATRIIAISEHTKQDLMRLYHIPEDRVDVVHLGNSLQPVTEMPSGMPALPERYVLYVGSRAKYKNFEGFMKAVIPLLKADKSLHVIAAGGYSVNNNFSGDELAWFAKEGISEQLTQMSINDQKLAYLYQNALCFVFPSLYEGFGIPALESFACCCPAVLSTASSLPEVGGEAALYADPHNEEELRHQIASLINDQALRETMVAKGKERLKLFSWEQAAAKTIEIYKRIQ
ncbi:Glycosyltransferase involved in cell wall bisynthesis [Filimonas lacunae]|uniref:Glycosyltransferase involved in cell wall bisynthesis n=1 Tax=Filimonas lacunae TaxID=477680 RepID=A0A173MI63_9BACT|nr:glycosyltransferase family 1 protein [Filimonas lacunae]BAV07189.1 mannosyltransferase [Filimonas lacunae]SIS93545.1 Glycosyltransferase involved in cell wall bisynthesis [Filimonas lacunae]